MFCLSVKASADFYLGASDYPEIADGVGSLELSAGYRLSENLGFELSWLALGEEELRPRNDGKTVSSGIDGTSIAVVTFLPTGADLALFGKLGFYYCADSTLKML